MLFRMIYDDKLAQAAYLIGCQRTGEAIIIDPQRDVDRYEKIAAKEGVRITAAAETHIHADFLTGTRELAEKGVKVYLSNEGGPDWTYQWLDKKAGGGAYTHQLLKHNDTFRVGNIVFRAVHTPGHTPEHLCFMVTDQGGGADEPMGVVTGDFVFVGDVGRPDLLETAAGVKGQADVSAHRLYASVRGFMSWPDHLQVWPGHGAGSACGKALGAVPQSTVGYEKRFNAAVRAAESESRFVGEMLAGQPEPPVYFARMKRDNKLGPRVLGGVPKPPRLGVEDVLKLDATACALIDTRSWDAFRAGHIRGSLFHPLNASFTTDAGSMVREGEAIYLVIEGSKVDEAVRELMHVGLDTIAGYIEPAVIDECRARGVTLATTAEITVGAAKASIDAGKVFVLDVRRSSEYAEGHVAGAVCIAHTRLADRLKDVPRDRPILVHCRSGGRSARAAALLQKHGYDATNVAGGFLAWEKQGCPVARG